MKVNLKPRAMSYPAPAAIASAYDSNGNANACTLAFVCMCSHHPPCVMIAINSTAKRKTLADILKTNEFCLAFPSTGQVMESDYLGIESGYNHDKLAEIGFTTTKAQKVNAPVINEFKLSLECIVLNKINVGSHTQLIGEIVNIQADESILNEKGKIDLKLLDPIAYDDVGHDYYKIGDKIADAFKIGLEVKNE